MPFRGRVRSHLVHKGTNENQNSIPDGAILTEDGLNYILTQNLSYSIQQEIDLTNAIITQDGLYYLTTNSNQVITTI